MTELSPSNLMPNTSRNFQSVSGAKHHPYRATGFASRSMLHSSQARSNFPAISDKLLTEMVKKISELEPASFFGELQNLQPCKGDETASHEVLMTAVEKNNF
jgi:hypothetical protein